MKTIPTASADFWPLVRFIAPAYPAVNIFSGSRITPLGLINVATAANKFPGLRVEVIDENNYRGPRHGNGLPDHAALQRDRPAAIVGFYCGLTSTMDRVYDLARFYRGARAVNLAGGWHVHYCPEEALNNGIDVVAHGDGETVIGQILQALIEHGDLSAIQGISFLDQGGAVVTNQPPMLEIPDLDQLPYPDFSLIRHAGKIKTYPINITKGCLFGCEFCSVNGRLRWASARHVFNIVDWLVETRGAQSFFIVDDRLEADEKERSVEGGKCPRRENLLAFLRLVREKYGRRLRLTVQIRLKAAEDKELLEAMKSAGVRTVCVGYESPIAEDLNSMHKGLSSQKMIEWTLILRRYFWVHGMFIFGYPNNQPLALPVEEMVRRYKAFIRRARISSVQVLHPVPLVGTLLRVRLESEGRIFPRSIAPWSKYDGSYACFEPHGMKLEELQETPIKLMKWFYSSWSFWRIPFRTVAFPFHYLAFGWSHWHYGWLRDIVRYGGHRLLVRWQRRNNSREYVARLKAYLH